MVLDGVNLKISSGDVYLLLGDNGAEKIASKVGILKKGQIILEKEVNTRGKLETVKIISSDADKINNYLEQRKIGRIIERTTQDITYEMHKGTSKQLVTEIISNGKSLSEIYRIKDELEKLYFDLTNKRVT